MAKIKFRDIRLSKDNKQRLGHINSIIHEYQEQGYRLTLRQLYYQLVSRDVIPNQQSEYGKLSKLLKEGRMAGIVDWAAIEDRLRTAEKPSSWEKPADIMESVIYSYAKPRMAGQLNYIEVWVEKDALSGVLSTVTEQYHIPILVNRGYSSASAIYDSYKRFRSALEDGQNIVILYLGDFDPSGIDMIRDVTERPLEMLLPMADEFMQETFEQYAKDDFYGDEREAHYSLEDSYQDDEDCFYEDSEGFKFFEHLRALIKKRFSVVPIALTRPQITQYNPPPNPAKRTDSRFEKFADEHGTQSWEVDALRPEVLNGLLENAITERIDLAKYEEILLQEVSDKVKLRKLRDKL